MKLPCPVLWQLHVLHPCARQHSALVDAILDRVVSQFDLPGLAERIVNDVAVKLASRITVEALNDAVLHSREEEALTHKLLERTIGGLSQALAAV